MTSRYGITKTVDSGYEETLKKTREALAREGLGVHTELDISGVIRDSLDKSFRRYMILGACSPALVHKALTVDTDMGLLLPSNVIVYESDGGGCTISAMNPVIATSMIENPAIALVSREVKEMLERAISAIE